MILKINTFSYVRCWRFVAQTSSTNYLAKINPELFGFFVPAAGCWDWNFNWSSFDSFRHSECWSEDV